MLSQTSTSNLSSTETTPSAIRIHACDWWGSTYKGGKGGRGR